jgi:hypothetical protein
MAELSFWLLRSQSRVGVSARAADLMAFGSPPGTFLPSLSRITIVSYRMRAYRPQALLASAASGILYGVGLLGVCITTGAGIGDWIGSILGEALPRRRRRLGNWPRIQGGAIGLGMACGVLIARYVTS